MTIAVGDRMPDGSFAIMRAGQPETLSAEDLFERKKVVLVSVPGAFTPTCSMHHLPGLVRQAGQILQQGVDTIACMAVNDVYVMEAWARHLGAGDQILMLADGLSAWNWTQRGSASASEASALSSLPTTLS